MHGALVDSVLAAGSLVGTTLSVARPYVILQRINLGLFAVLGELSATAD